MMLLQCETLIIDEFMLVYNSSIFSLPYFHILDPPMVTLSLFLNLYFQKQLYVIIRHCMEFTQTKQ